MLQMVQFEPYCTLPTSAELPCSDDTPVDIAVLVYVRYTRRGTACRAPTPWDITLYRI